MRKFVKEHGITADMLVRDGALRAEYLEILKRGFSNQRLAERAVERARRTFLENRIPDLEKMEQDFDVIRNGGTEPDEVVYRDNLRKIVREDDGELTGDFVKYARDMIEPSVLQKGVRNGRDRFDRYGNERSFHETHLPYTLEGIVLAMKTKGSKNTESGMFGTGVSEVRAAGLKEMESIAQIKKEANRKLKNLPEEKNGQCMMRRRKI